MATAVDWKQVKIGVGISLLALSLVAFGVISNIPSGVSASTHPNNSIRVPLSNGTTCQGSTCSANTSSTDLQTGILTLAASIAIAGGLIGTGMAQSGIGAAGMGIIAERPEKFGQVLVFFVIPETLWIIGLVLGFLLLLKIL